ncbi:hypothetical protein [Bradyrhizobium sp. dw_78]|uniref:COG4223 family protein n=1 Tax=Bradyrhizobium sp. dw_78 TaxID=2719793 RepID=UPI001BD33ECE|nr:hypothetical protein [Bradyrhizobium sp. dw_78]
MADDRPDDTAASPDSGRAKRAPPTIDLEATEVSDKPAGPAGNAPTGPKPGDSAPKSGPQQPEFGESGPKGASAAASISPWVVAPVSGAVAAALVIGVGWMLGWPAVQPASTETSSAALTARVASLESRVNKPLTPDPAVAALEKSVASLREELSAVRAQSDRLAGDANGATPGSGDAAATADLSAINGRLDQLERATRDASAAAAQQSARPLDDTSLRRVVVASLLDISVRQGDPFTAALDAAKSLAPDPDTLKPLEDFAATGVPTAAALSRELLALIPKLSPPAQENGLVGSNLGLVDRLQAGASRLVRIERTDAVGNDRGAIVARATAAALRNDANEARRELNTLSPANRAPAQAWIDKADGRDASLAASRQFAADALAALAKPAP